MTPQQLDDLFREAREREAEPSAELMGRILADAYTEQPSMPVQAALPLHERRRRGGLWQAIFGAHSAQAIASGLAMATLTGVWIGFVQPAPVADLASSLASAEAIDMVELIPSYDSWLPEG